MRSSLNLKSVLTSKILEITNYKQSFICITCVLTCQPSYIYKNGSDVAKPRFGRCFCHNFVNFKNFVNIFWNIRVVYGLWKSWRTVILIRNMHKTIRNLRSQIVKFDNSIADFVSFYSNMERRFVFKFLSIATYQYKIWIIATK